MAQSFVRVPVDGLGKLIDTWVTAVALQHRQAIVIGDPSVDANVISISSRLRLPIELENLFDFDTGAGTDETSTIGLVLPANGGAAVAGIVSNPLFVRLSDGAIAISTLPISAASLPLPAGAATEASVQSIEDVAGATTGAKVITDANGTIQQYLRGLIYLLITSGQALVSAALLTGSNLIGYVGGKNTYAAKATITCTLTSLANGSARESTVIDNTSNRYKDALIRFQSTGQAGATSYVNLYVYEALGDTTYTDGATGSDAAFTAGNRLNSRYLGSLLMNTTNDVIGCFKLSDVFVTIPDKWGLIVINNSGGVLSATAGDHVLEYQGIN